MVLKDAPFALAHLVHPREHSVQCRSLLLTSNQRTLRGSRFLLLQVMQGRFRARKYNAQKTFTWNQCATRHEHPVHREGSLWRRKVGEARSKEIAKGLDRNISGPLNPQ